ncbi:MAG: putative selenium-dependent hydroxylase accessory protein YqeC [Chloroflexi bacterium]|nr:putative selenium-dependent hydroxylase accessory protein YqeC [Chloroflexota bacterium]
MLFSTALRILPGSVVAFVGGGGKTTAMFCLADEFVRAGGKVITTTTTRIFAAQSRLAPVHVQSLAALQIALQTSPHVLITGEVKWQEGKAYGLAPEVVDNLRSLPGVQAVLVEADGSRTRPFKAPADHEPVIPASTTLVVIVVGIDALGQALTAEHVHRPERVARLFPGEVVSPEMIAAVLAHPAGGRKNVPAGARCVALINKVETESQRRAADHLSTLLLSRPGIDGVAIGAVAHLNNPILDYTEHR